MHKCELLVIGGGAAGISAARAAYENGCSSILLVERKKQLGGVLLQCAHTGFGKGLTGPLYAEQLLRQFPAHIRVMTDTCVTQITEENIAVMYSAADQEVYRVHFHRLLLAAGCRERTAGSLLIAGNRPQEIYTAGQMQEMMNLHHYRPIGPVVILGSGDLGLIMAWQIAALGNAVTLVEQSNHCGGIQRNRQCLKHPLVKLVCGTTIEEVFGETHLEGVRLQNGRYLPCSILLIAAGLICDRELIRGMEKNERIYCAGNCASVHGMIETVVQEGIKVGTQAATFAWDRC